MLFSEGSVAQIALSWFGSWRVSQSHTFFKDTRDCKVDGSRQTPSLLHVTNNKLMNKNSRTSNFGSNRKHPTYLVLVCCDRYKYTAGQMDLYCVPPRKLETYKEGQYFVLKHIFR